jgi:hypothetical protein
MRAIQSGVALPSKVRNPKSDEHSEHAGKRRKPHQYLRSLLTHESRIKGSDIVTKWNSDGETPEGDNNCSETNNQRSPLLHSDRVIEIIDFQADQRVLTKSAIINARNSSMRVSHFAFVIGSRRSRLPTCNAKQPQIPSTRLKSSSHRKACTRTVRALSNARMAICFAAGTEVPENGAPMT